MADSQTGIDAKLKALQPAWTIVRHKLGMDTSKLHCVAVEEYPTQNGQPIMHCSCTGSSWACAGARG